MSTELFKLAQELAARPYFIMKSKDETTDGQSIYIARTLEIENCIGQGNTPEEAVLDLRGALVDYIESLLGDGLSVPEPIRLEKIKGTSISKTINMSNRFIDPASQTNLANNSYILKINT